ncbi:MAG: MFS transporter [Chloroflexi bacterium]|nr:MAG: MFS transporter [Chloroflexota bacterium]
MAPRAGGHFRVTRSDPVVTLGRFVDRLIPPGWRVLAVPDFRRLWLAHGGSVIGDGFHAIAITWLVFQTLGGGAQALVFLGIANLVPSLALGILSGTIVDRLDRRRVMVGTDLIRAALVASLALLVASGMASVPVVIAMGMSLTVAALFFYPARNSVLAAYVAEEDLVPANALMQATAQGAQLLAPALGGVLFVAIGPVGLLAIDAASFVWSAFLLSRLTPGPALPGPEPRRPLLHEAADGLRFIAGHAPSRLCVLTGAANQLFASGPWRVIVPVWVAVALGGGAIEYGTILSAFAAGLISASLVVSAIRSRLPLLTLIAAGVFLDGAIEILLAFSPTLAFAAMALFAMGMSNAVLNASFSALMQTAVPNEMRGRTFATFSTGINLTTPVSLAATGALASVIGPVAILTIAGAGLMIVGALSFGGSLRVGRAISSSASA